MRWKGPSKFTSLKGVTFDCAAQEEVERKVKERARQSFVLRDLEGDEAEDKRITRIEVVLAGTALGLRGAEGGPGDFVRLQQAYRYADGQPVCQSPEAVAIAAKTLSNHESVLPQWFRDNIDQFLDSFLALCHHNIHRDRGKKAKHRSETLIEDLPGLANLTARNGIRPGPNQGDERDAYRQSALIYSRGITAYAQLRGLAAISPIAVLVLTEPRKIVGYEHLETFLRLAPPKDHVTDGPNQKQWIAWFYAVQNGPLAQRVHYERPRSVWPIHYLGRLRSDKDRDFSEEVRDELELAKDELSDYSHFAFVIAVWKDFVLPNAEKGLVGEVSLLKDMLLGHCQGALPPQGRYGIE